MGWLQNIFKSNELKYLEQLYVNEKESRLKLEIKVETLETENKLLQHKLMSQEVAVSEKTNTKKKLSPKEKEVYDQYLKLDEQVSQAKFSEISKIRIASLRTMISRIRKKGYNMEFY